MLERNIVELARPSLDALARGQRRDDQPGRARARRSRAHRPGGQPALPRRRAVARALGGLRASANGKVFAAFGRAPASRSRTPPGRRRTARAPKPVRRDGVRHVDRRARDRPVRDGGAGARRAGRGDRGAQHLGPDAADDARRGSRAATDLDQRGADAQPPPRPPRARRTAPHDRRRDPPAALRRDAGRERPGGSRRRRTRVSSRDSSPSGCSTTR